jgi:hypothetical protein
MTSAGQIRLIADGESIEPRAVLLEMLKVGAGS